MLVKDTEFIERAKSQAAVEAYREQVIAWARLEEANCSLLLDPDTDPTFIPRRLGRTMTHEELERKIKKLVPAMQFVSGPGTQILNTKKMILLGPDGQERWSCIYNIGVIPERSICARMQKDVLDLSKVVYSRADLPKYEFVPGEGYVWDPTTPAMGFKRVDIPHREIKRGWRTILLRMIVEDVLPLAAIERVFGSDNTPNWQQHTGKKDWRLPF